MIVEPTPPISLSRYMRDYLTVTLRAKIATAPQFEVFPGHGMLADWYFRERTAGKITSTGGEGYSRKASAKRAAYAHAARIAGSKVTILDF